MTTKSRYRNSTQIRKTSSRSRACPGHTFCPGGVVACGVEFLGCGVESRARYPVLGSCPRAAFASCERKWEARPPRMGGSDVFQSIARACVPTGSTVCPEPVLPGGPSGTWQVDLPCPGEPARGDSAVPHGWKALMWSSGLGLRRPHASSSSPNLKRWWRGFRSAFLRRFGQKRLR